MFFSFAHKLSYEIKPNIFKDEFIRIQFISKTEIRKILQSFPSFHDLKKTAFWSGPLVRTRDKLLQEGTAEPSSASNITENKYFHLHDTRRVAFVHERLTSWDTAVQTGILQ